jgi:hypothetical protein
MQYDGLICRSQNAESWKFSLLKFADVSYCSRWRFSYSNGLPQGPINIRRENQKELYGPEADRYISNESAQKELMEKMRRP